MLAFLLKLISFTSVLLLLAFGIAFFGNAFVWYRERTGHWAGPLFWTILWVLAAAAWLIYMFG